MSRVFVTKITLVHSTGHVNEPVSGTVFGETTDITDPTLTLTLFQGTTLIETLNIADVRQNPNFVFAIAPNALGDYRITQNGDPESQYHLDFQVIPVGAGRVDVQNAGFIPITGVDTGIGGLAPLIPGRRYAVGIDLRRSAPAAGYVVNLKLGFAWNGTGNLSLGDVPDFIQLRAACQNTPAQHIDIAGGSRSGTGSFEIGIVPSDFPDWTFIVMAQHAIKTPALVS